MRWRGRGATRLPEGEKRRQATNATLERYRNKAFDWATGITCVHLARTQMRNMGHRPPSLPRFRSALAAKKAMQERGWKSVEQMLDSLLPRIAPAQMLPGDLATFEGDGGFDSVRVCCGPRRFFGWSQGHDAPTVIEATLDEVLGAWRV